MPKVKDPGLHHAHRRLLRPWKRATGPGSYDEWKRELWEERERKRAAKSESGALKAN